MVEANKVIKQTANMPLESQGHRQVPDTEKRQRISDRGYATTNFLRSKKTTLKKSGRGQHSKYNPTAFTEKVTGAKIISTPSLMVEAIAEAKDTPNG